MTKPTPAQIEAARAEIRVALVGLSDRSTSPAFIAERLDRAYTALAAAAEVAEKERKDALWKGTRDPQVGYP